MDLECVSFAAAAAAAATSTLTHEVAATGQREGVEKRGRK